MLTKTESLVLSEPSDKPDVSAVFADHGDFVWQTLQRLGIRDADLDDLLQEVFVVVHRRIGSFDGTCRMRTWLFAISLRVAQAHRRRGYVKHERFGERNAKEIQDTAKGPELIAEEREARTRLEAILQELNLEKRVVFVMFEIEEIACDEIASMLGVPIGTVYSRLHSARQAFQQALLRMRARETRAGTQ